MFKLGSFDIYPLLPPDLRQWKPLALYIRPLSLYSAETQRNALTARLRWLHIVLGPDRPLAGSLSHDILLGVEREQHASALMSKWSGLEDEAMTPGWSGTK